MARYFDSTLGHKVRRKAGVVARVWKRKGAARPRQPHRVPLDRCSTPLWRVQDISGKVVKFVGTRKGKPIISTVAGKPRITGVGPAETFAGSFVQRIIRLEHFKGDVLTFVQTRSRVKDLRDETTMSIPAFNAMVSRMIGSEFTLKV